jgi:hypothetical protein
MTNYQQQKSEFLDSLKPDDFRNPASLNQADLIIEQLRKELQKNKENPEEFVRKAAENLFRNGSTAIERLLSLLTKPDDSTV